MQTNSLILAFSALFSTEKKQKKKIVTKKKCKKYKNKFLSLYGDVPSL